MANELVQINIELGKPLDEQMEGILKKQFLHQKKLAEAVDEIKMVRQKNLKKKIQLVGIAPINQKPAISDDEIKALMKEFGFDAYIEAKDLKPGAKPKYTLDGVSNVTSDFTSRNMLTFAGVIAGAMGVTGLTLAGLFSVALMGAIGLAAIATPFGLPIVAAVLLGAAIIGAIAFAGVVVFATLKQVKEQKELDKQEQDSNAVAGNVKRIRLDAHQNIIKTAQKNAEAQKARDAHQQEISKTISNYKEMFDAMAKSTYFSENVSVNFDAWRSIFETENVSGFEVIKSKFFEYAIAYVLVHMKAVLYQPDQNMKNAEELTKDPVVKKIYSEVFKKFDDESSDRTNEVGKQYRAGADVLELYNNEIKAAKAFKDDMQAELNQRLSPEGLEVEHKKQAKIDLKESSKNLDDISATLRDMGGPGNKPGGNNR